MKEKVQDSVARLLRAPPYAARRKELGFGYPSCLRSQSDRSTVVVGNCTFCTDNGGSSPRQSNPLYTFVDPVSAPDPPNEGEFGGAAGYRPRVRSAYYERVYAHSPGEPGPDKYRRAGTRPQGPWPIAAIRRAGPVLPDCRAESAGLVAPLPVCFACAMTHTPIALTDSQLADALLGALEDHVLPLTRQGVAAGNKIFGAALLRKSDGRVVLAETNNETENPLWHGEVHLLKRYREMPDMPPPDALIFLSTHEPCSMCLSAITWAGFDNFFDFFTHEDSRDAFAIPHDLKILQEVFGLGPGGYRRENAYWRARSVAQVISGAALDMQGALRARSEAIASEYAALSAAYQDGKAGNAIPLN